MKAMIIGLAVAICGYALFAQQAKVIQLSASDATEVRSKWEALQAAQKEWSEEQRRIAEKYTYVRFGDSDKGTMEAPGNSWPSTGIYISSPSNCWGCPEVKETEDQKKKREEESRKQWDEYRAKAWWYRSGWETGFQFTDDFKFIVPKQPDIKQQSFGGQLILNPATTVN